MLIPDEAYIQVLLNTINDQQKKIQELNNKLNNLIQNYDVVEVIRCKNCRYASFISYCNKYECIYRKCLDEYGTSIKSLTNSEDFCTHGQRKANNAWIKTLHFCGRKLEQEDDK